MASANTGQKSKPNAKFKGGVRSLKRKRDVEDVERLQTSVSELVSGDGCGETQALRFNRIRNQK
jgi:hypothetical protein